MYLKRVTSSSTPSKKAAAPAVIFLLLCLTGLVYGQSVTINPAVQYQTFEGWGVSICWWGNQIGGWSEQNRNALIEYVVNPDTGLGYNVYRFNIGGGENPAHSHMTQFRNMPGYQPARGTWNWNADANQRTVLLRLLERGKALGQNMIIEAFSNSPPYWMTASGCASGASSGSADNLATGNYPLFADYLTEVVNYYKNTYGITFRTLEPLNEPTAGWWSANGTQEGCTFNAANHSALLNAIGQSLAAKGLTGTTVSAPDETSIDATITSVNGYTSSALAYVSQLNTHSYSGSRRTELKSLAQRLGKRLWQSESGPLGWSGNDNDVAILLAARIIQDLREMQPVAWIDWQVVDVGIWGTIHVDQAAQTFTLAKRFYMHSNFSRFIRPGSVFIDCNNSNMIAALNPQKNSLTLVICNTSTSASSTNTINLASFTTVGSAAAVYRTSASENLAKLADVPITNRQFTVTVPAYSVTTYVIPVSGGSSPTPTPTPTPTPSGTNLALGKAASTDSMETGNGAVNGNDGSLTSRWCAADGATGHWWKVDLGAIYNLTGSEVIWELSRAYQYMIEASADNTTWQTVADKRNNTTSAPSQIDFFNQSARYVRITVTGLEAGVWASFYELRVFGGTNNGIMGDANGDGSVNVVDALLTAQVSGGQTPTPFNRTNADVNCDNTVSIIDALLIAQKTAGLITNFPCTR